MKKPVFIVGLPRSGSTLWHNIVVMDPEIFRIGEMIYMSPFRKDIRHFIQNKVGDLSTDDNVEKLVGLLFSQGEKPGLYSHFWNVEILKFSDPGLKRKLVDAIKTSDRSLGSVFRILLEEITVHNSYNRYCVKFPIYVAYMQKLIEWFPGCRVIHITRDPRAISASKTIDPDGTAALIKKYPYMSHFIRKIMILFVVFQYFWSSRLHVRFKKYDNYALFKYEDLLVNHEKVVKDLCRFSEIDFKPEMLDLQKSKHEHQVSSLTGKRQKGLDKKAASRWESSLTPFEKWLVTTLTKGSMRRFDYDSDTHPVFQED